jgi:hypothetical protein
MLEKHLLIRHVCDEAADFHIQAHNFFIHAEQLEVLIHGCSARGLHP